MSNSATMKRWVVGAAAVVLAVAPAVAGVVYEIEVTDHGQSPPKSESIQVAVEGRNLKMGMAAGGRGARGEMIFRGGEMIIVDHDNRSYHLMNKAAMESLAGQLGDLDRMMREALKNVPEDRRAMVEQMMKQRQPNQPATKQRPESELRKTNERGDRNGYPCVKYEVLRDGSKTRELWVTDKRPPCPA